MRQEVSIKIAKLQLLKGLWTAKFSFDKSIEEMVEAYHLFIEAIGDENNFYSANCQIEIGQNYLRKRDITNATEFFNGAVKIYETLFGDAHPVMQKYYNYSSEIYSTTNDHPSMMQMVHKYLEIVEKTNTPRDPTDPPSVFIMDALLQVISLECQNTQHQDPKVLDDLLERMENICGQHGLVNGCQLSHSAQTMKTMRLIKPETFEVALTRLEEIYPKQLATLKNCKTHPFLEQTINQMAILYKVVQKEAKSEELYKNLVDIKLAYYGNTSESLMVTLKNLGGV